MEDQLTLSDAISILKRRIYYLLAPFALVLVASVAVALAIPPSYQATGTILVESQQIPDALIKSTVTSYADERIAIIKQRVMTRANLLAIIDKYRLFQDSNQGLTSTEKVEEMRQAIWVRILQADTKGNRRAGSTTISFTVSFEYNNPQTAFKVVNEIITLFLDENVKARTERATETTEFLAQEATKLQRNLEEIESTIARYKQKNQDALPEHLNLHMDMLRNADEEIKGIDREIRTLREQQQFLEIELRTAIAAAESGVPMRTAGGARQADSPAQQLSKLQLQLTQLRATYGDLHPDVKAVQRRVESLRKEVDPASVRADLERNLAELEDQHRELLNRYSEQHPDVVRVNGQIAELQSEIDSLPSPRASERPADSAAAAESPVDDDPMVAQVQAKIRAVESRIKAYGQQKVETSQRLEELQAAVLRTPQVERGLQILARDLENARRKYDEVRAKQMSAQLAESLEEENKAERFSLIEPPVVPEKPSKPNRQKLIAMGVALSMAAGGGGVVVMEMLDQSIRGPSGLTSVLRRPPLVSIPYIVTRRQRRRRKRNLILLAILSLVALAAGVLGVHLFYMPLDLLILKVMIRLS